MVDQFRFSAISRFSAASRSGLGTRADDEETVVSIRGHRTACRSRTGWEELGLIAAARGLSLAALIIEIDRTRSGGLSSAVRLFVLEDLRQKAAACRTVAPDLD